MKYKHINHSLGGFSTDLFPPPPKKTHHFSEKEKLFSEILSGLLQTTKMMNHYWNRVLNVARIF